MTDKLAQPTPGHLPSSGQPAGQKEPAAPAGAKAFSISARMRAAWSLSAESQIPVFALLHDDQGYHAFALWYRKFTGALGSLEGTATLPAGARQNFLTPIVAPPASTLTEHQFVDFLGVFLTQVPESFAFELFDWLDYDLFGSLGFEQHHHHRRP